MVDSDVRYFSTRGGSETLTFEEAVLTGLAPNGGLYIPTHIPSLPSDWQTSWSKLSFPELSHAILSLFIPTSVIPPSDLSEIINTAYSSFRDPKTTPLRQTGEKEYVMELWHGPTWAFKDVALQFLGELFRYFLERRNGQKKEGEKKEELTVVGATSGDTGSAAIYGLRSKPSITIFILYPDGRVSPIQEAQMATVPDENVYCVAVEDSDFDTCQSIVKTLFSDAEFNAAHRLGAINSINWARILAQIVYYFSAYFQLPEASRNDGSAKLQFVVPTGNFGDILAGWFAKKLGLPMGELVVATNENDILARFFKTGRYESDDAASAKEEVASQAPETAAVNGSSDGQQATPSSSSAVKATHSPAMDILLSSNFERLLFYLALETGGEEGSDVEKRGRAQERLNSWMSSLKKEGKVNLGEDVRKAAVADFWAERVSDDETLQEIRKYYKLEQYGPYVVDPHTAVGLAAQERSAKKASPDITWVTLSTAHPAKFSSAVELALSASDFPSFDFRRDVLPDELKKLESLEKRVHKVKGEQGVRDLIEKVKKGEKYDGEKGRGSL
ncbi:threonine synthase [Kwoniella shandongensis]|uniref:Threonine synthase n=1 Tax=Kwoniella shandongensis TaxID=1734106 RepID=A0A5M6BWT3_9TREE|nr:threonine synthase [Kwoniella shandongensis]KAA5525875.1 threonine synthase [Kwoniella shandongensis]